MLVRTMLIDQSVAAHIRPSSGAANSRKEPMRAAQTDEAARRERSANSGSAPACCSAWPHSCAATAAAATEFIW